jgi:methyltransferase-like protein
MQNLEQKYKRNKDFVYRKIENETILVPIKNNVGDMGCIYNLNEVGAFVWEHLDGEKTMDDLKNMVTEKFDVSDREAEEDLYQFVGDLIDIEAIHQ